jgi:hypothetical protein
MTAMVLAAKSDRIWRRVHGMAYHAVRAALWMTSDAKLVVLELLELDSTAGHPDANGLGFVAKGCGFSPERTKLALAELARHGVAALVEDGATLCYPELAERLWPGKGFGAEQGLKSRLRGIVSIHAIHIDDESSYRGHVRSHYARLSSEVIKNPQLTSRGTRVHLHVA